MKFWDEEGFTFDDVLLRPGYSKVGSRHNPDTNFEIRGEKLSPIIVANMESTGVAKMALALGDLNILVPLHRFCSIDEQVSDLCAVRNAYPSLVAASFGLDDEDRVDALLHAGVRYLFLDVAYAYTERCLSYTDHLRKKLSDYNVVLTVGNVGTGEAVADMSSLGVDLIKCGIGPGCSCQTRRVTGCGVPQLSAIIECSQEGNIIADGGIRSSGDIVKALAAGASAVMTGALFAGCPEATGDIISGRKRYRGLASKEAQVDRFGQLPDGIAPEGVETLVTCQPPAREVAENLLAGIRAGMAILGANDLQELRKKATFQRVSAETIHENETR